MSNYKKDLIIGLGEFTPGLFLLITDVIILAGSGAQDQIAGASVAGILLGAIARLCRALNSTNQKLAEKHRLYRVPLISTTYYWGILGISLAVVVWLGANSLEEFVGLKGMSGYLMYACPAFALSAIRQPARMSLKINLMRQVPRVKLAWFMAASNVASTYVLVNFVCLGAEGASLGTLLAQILPTCLLVHWAHSDKVLQLPSTRFLGLVYGRSRKKVRAQVPAMVGSFAALLLNRWLGTELATIWTYAHTACDVIGGIVVTGWATASQHYTLNLSNPKLAKEAWDWIDRVCIGVVIVGAIASAWVCSIAPVIVLAYCIPKRFDFMSEREGKGVGFDKQGDSKLAYTTCCIVGYGVLVAFAQPDVWAATGVYAVGMTAMVFVLRK